MFDLPHRGFHRDPQVPSLFIISCTASTALSYLRLLLTELQAKTHISFARSGRALPSLRLVHIALGTSLAIIMRPRLVW